MKARYRSAWPRYVVLGQNCPGAEKYIVATEKRYEDAVDEARQANADRTPHAGAEDWPKFAVIECKVVGVWTKGEELT